MEIIFALTEGIFPIFIFFSTVNNSFNSILLNLFTFFINVTNNNMAFPKIVSANASLYNLACTKLIDRIVVFENAKLIEDGTHQELLNLHGKYFELFNMQAQFYQ